MQKKINVSREKPTALSLSCCFISAVATEAPTNHPPEQALPQSVTDLDAMAEHLATGGTPPRGLRILIFQRDQRAQARIRWPQTYPDPDDQYYPAAEARWRSLADNGARDMQIVPVTVAELVDFAHRTGADPTDAAVKTQYIQTICPKAIRPAGLSG